MEYNLLGVVLAQFASLALHTERELVQSVSFSCFSWIVASFVLRAASLAVMAATFSATTEFAVSRDTLAVAAWISARILQII